MGFDVDAWGGKYAAAVMKAPRARWWDPRTWLAFMFWELRTIARAVSDDGLSDWKATGTIVIFEILAIVGLTNAAAVYLGRRLIDKGSPFSEEFEGYPRAIRIVGGFAVVLLVVGAIILAGHFGEAQPILLVAFAVAVVNPCDTGQA